MASKKEFSVENKSNPGKPAGASTFRGKDIYTPKLTSTMHGKAKGGHPTKRAEEMKGC